MAEYKNKIDTIIDKLVHGNLEFHNKKFSEQSYMKMDIAKCINGAISTLNDLGQKLALDEFDIQIEQNEAKIFDNNGNINTIELTKITNVVVKTTIEKAEKKGIIVTNIGKKNNNEKDTNIEFSENDFGKMIENYFNLSGEDKKKLWKNYSKMSRFDQKKLEDANIKIWEDIANDTENPELKTVSKEIADYLKLLQDLRDSKDPKDQEILLEIIKADKKFLEWYRENVNKEIDLSEHSSQIVEFYSEYVNENNIEIQEIVLAKDTQIQELSVNETIKDYTKEIERRHDYIELMKNQEFLQFLEENGIKTNLETPPLNDEIVKLMNSFTNRQLQKAELENVIEDGKKGEEVNIDIVTELEKSNLLIPDIQSSLIQYKEFLTDLEQEDIEYLCELTIEERNQQLAEIFYEIDPQNIDILNQLTNITFNGVFRDVLKNEDGKNILLQQLDQLIVPTKEASLTDAEFEQGLLEGTLAFEEMLFEVQERTEETIQEEEDSIIDDTDEHEGTDNRDIEEQEVDAMSLEIQGMEEYFSFLKTTDIDVNDLTEEANTIKAVSDPENERVNDEVDK